MWVEVALAVMVVQATVNSAAWAAACVATSAGCHGGWRQRCRRWMAASNSCGGSTSACGDGQGMGVCVECCFAIKGAAGNGSVCECVECCFAVKGAAGNGSVCECVECCFAVKGAAVLQAGH
eukprot:1157884-Pelagomonas_calceolata.AAC.1